jgi:hypothetical protein
VFIAGPVLSAWKEREGVYRRRRAAIAAAHGGVVPAYATAAVGPVDVEPEQRARRRERLTAAEGPERQVSKAEFDDMVADLHADPGARPTAVVEREEPAPERRGRRAPKPPPAAEPEPPADESADLQPEDVVMPDQPKPRQPKPRGASKSRNRKHGRH